MPRVKSSPKKCIKINIQQPENSWVFLLKGEGLKSPSEPYSGTGTPDIVALRHPNTGESTRFLFSPANNSIQEILEFNEGKRSWFIDDFVKSNGKMQLSTPIDPIFLVLPYLRKYCTTHAIPLEQLLRDEEYPETQRLLQCSGLNYLGMIADRKGDEELNAYKYNEEKTLNWLKKKTERVAEILKQKNLHINPSSVVSSNFIKSTSSDTNDYLKYAHGIVSDYIVDELSKKLLKFLNLPEIITPIQNSTTSKRKSTNDISTGDIKKAKIDNDNKTISLSSSPSSSLSNNCVLDLSKSETKTKNLTTKEKARLKAASSSKTISSFFKKT